MVASDASGPRRRAAGRHESAATILSGHAHIHSMGLIRTCALACCFLVMASRALAGPFEDGVAAYDRGQFAAALELWLPLAREGNVAAQLGVGMLYERGSGVAPDAAEAVRWYLRAAEGGNAEAQYRAALAYETGSGAPKDLEQARKWYRDAATTPRTDADSMAAKQRARERLARLITRTEEVVAYTGGRFVIVRFEDEACVIALQGAITRDTSLKFDAVVAKCAGTGGSRPLVLLESPGGALREGIGLGRDVRLRGFRTATRHDCASACALIFMAGAERVLVGSRARIGLHQASSMGGRLASDDRRCSASSDSTGVREMRQYVRWAIPATADEVMRLIMQTPCDAIEWVGGQRAVDLGIATRLEAEGIEAFGSNAAARQ
jgi:hypothetical protein